MRRILDGLYQGSGWAAAFCIGLICLLVMVQVSLNLIDKLASLLFGQAIGLTLPSYADFTGFFLAAASFLALAHTLREGGHIRVSLLLGILPPRLRCGFELATLAVAAAMTSYFCFYMARLTAESFSYHDLSTGMIAVPLWIPQSSLLVGLAVLTVALVDELLSVLRGHAPSYQGKGENLLVSNDADEPADDWASDPPWPDSSSPHDGGETPPRQSSRSR